MGADFADECDCQQQTHLSKNDGGHLCFGTPTGLPSKLRGIKGRNTGSRRADDRHVLLA